MARKLQTLYQVEGVLTAKTALHVGGSAASLTDDMPLARNGKGELYFPGTSLTGPMRNWWVSRYGEANADIFFGRTAPGNKDEGHASRIFVADGPVTGTETEIRDGIKINAETGAAESGFKYDREVLPAGSTIGLNIRLELDDVAQNAGGEKKFATLVKALSGGHIQFGAAKTRGLGMVEATGLKASVSVFNQREGMLALLAAKQSGNMNAKAATFDFDTLGESPALDHKLTVTIQWQSVLPVFNVGASYASAIDDAPLMSGVDGKAPTLTGASIKGALRAHAARICRTVFGGGAHDQHELVVALFGAAGEKSDPKSPKTVKRPGLGAVSVADCVTGPSVTSVQWKAVLSTGGKDEVKSVNAQEAIDATPKLAGWRVQDHTAIDRWTGGVSDSALFSSITPAAGQFGHFDITVDYNRLSFKEGGDKQAAALGLLLLVLRDLQNEKISFGFGATRGNGALTIKAINFTEIGTHFGGLGFDGKGLPLEKALTDFGTIAKAWATYCATQMIKAA